MDITIFRNWKINLQCVGHWEFNLHNINDVDFVGGRLKYFYKNWVTITTEPEILETIQGLKINFSQVPNPSTSQDRPTKHFEPEVIKNYSLMVS